MGGIGYITGNRVDIARNNVLINVNITDITDESGYIEAIGQKAASQAIQQARGDVAEQEKLGETRVAAAERDKPAAALDTEGEQLVDQAMRQRLGLRPRPGGSTVLRPAIDAAYTYRDSDRPLNVVLLSEIPTTYDKDQKRQVNAGNLLLRGVPAKVSTERRPQVLRRDRRDAGHQTGANTADTGSARRDGARRDGAHRDAVAGCGVGAGEGPGAADDSQSHAASHHVGALG